MPVRLYARELRAGRPNDRNGGDSGGAEPHDSTGLPGARGGHFSPPVTRFTPPAHTSPPVAVIAAGPRYTPAGSPGATATRPRATTSALREEEVPARRAFRPRLPQRTTTTTTTSGGVVRRNIRSNGSEGDGTVGGGTAAEPEDDSDESWTVAEGRAARRRARRVRARLSSDEEASGMKSRAAPSPLPLTAVNYPPLRGFVTRSTVSGGTPPAGPAEVAARPEGIGECVAVPTCALVSVRGVMGQRGTRAPVVEARPGRAGASAVPATTARGGARPPALPRSPPAAARGELVAAPVALTARQKVAERRRLVAAADSAGTLADLERLMTQVVGFFGEREQGGGAPRPRGRSVRSREAGDNARRAGGVGDGANSEGGSAPAEPPMFGGETRADAGREAARLQALFKKNRRKAIREVLSGPAEVCDVSTQRVSDYFRRLYCGAGNLSGAAPAELPETSGDGEQAAELIRPITEREVDRRLRRVNNSAPELDGLTYCDLRLSDPTAQLLAAVFNACLRLEAVPASWKIPNTSCLFAAVLADRLTDWAIAGRKLSPPQKGFLRDEGCYEHNFVLQEILTDARRDRREVVVAWLDFVVLLCSLAAWPSVRSVALPTAPLAGEV
ncbi:endochitinase A1-like [Odontomachus brunneus]|uniref:endochitinase A1-like n=1 Tax=Odontomachus brunneus TaxID=486640 RepID=UPI0013F2A855|nr:endochitinase A1-like [Odontomachus brunneus]